MSTACRLCRVPTTRRRATLAEPHLHVADGLQPVLLAGIDVNRCPSCRAEVARIPNVRSLHRAIAGSLARQPERLSGAQVRFLRRLAGIPAGRFAALLGIDSAHLSRVENAKLDSLGAPADRLVRILTVAAGSARQIRQALGELDAADPAGKGSRSRVPRSYRVSKGGRWSPSS